MALGGPSIVARGKVEAHIADLSATLLRRLGLSVPTSFTGRVLWEALTTTDDVVSRKLPEITQVRRRVPGNEALVEGRLRALGYIE